MDGKILNRLKNLAKVLRDAAIDPESADHGLMISVAENLDGIVNDMLPVSTPSAAQTALIKLRAGIAVTYHDSEWVNERVKVIAAALASQEQAATGRMVPGPTPGEDWRDQTEAIKTAERNRVLARVREMVTAELPMADDRENMHDALAREFGATGGDDAAK